MFNICTNDKYLFALKRIRKQSRNAKFHNVLQSGVVYAAPACCYPVQHVAMVTGTTMCEWDVPFRSRKCPESHSFDTAKWRGSNYLVVILHVNRRDVGMHPLLSQNTSEPNAKLQASSVVITADALCLFCCRFCCCMKLWIYFFDVLDRALQRPCVFMRKLLNIMKMNIYETFWSSALLSCI
jgi:hypothetical protein